MFFVLPIINPQVRVSVVNRVIAKTIDIILIFYLAVTLYPVGALLGFLYSIFGDGLNIGPFHGQSLGKKVMKLQVVSIPDLRPVSWQKSALRNAPVGVATFFAIIPVWGWLILGLVGIPLMIMEIYLMLTVESGHRLGDVMGDTEVVEVKRRLGV